MIASNFSLCEYCHRIGFTGEPCRDLATLTELMSHQLRSVPFENTEVQARRTPSLVPEDIYSKIVTDRRGGYCYEVNGLFAMALSAIGFECYFAGARPMFYPERRPKTHMVVIVTIDEEHYLCDTGFGRYGIREPIHVEDGSKSEQNGDRYHLELMDGEYVLRCLSSDEWIPLYGFTLGSQEWIEFSLANHFNATHPDAIFTQKKLAVLQTLQGRKILVDENLKIIENGVMTQSKVDYDAAAQEHFGLKIVARR